MSEIQRLEYENRKRKSSDFEIIDLQHFFKTRPHSHLIQDFRLNFWILMYVTESEGEHDIDFRTYHYQAGDILILQKNQVHHFHINERVQGYILIINEAFFYDQDGKSGDALLDFFNRPFGLPILSIDNSRASANRTIIDLIYTEYTKCDGCERAVLIRSLLQSFVLSLDDFLGEDRALYHSAEFHTYSRFRSLLEKYYTHKKSVDDYAGMMGVTTKTLNAATRRLAGLSAKEFITERIILEIKRFLSLGELLTYEISDKLGFDDPSNMTKFFKRYEGMSPSAFKESLK